MNIKKQDVGVSDIDSYLRKMKITTDTKITLALLIELMYGFTKENLKDGYVLTEDELREIKRREYDNGYYARQTENDYGFEDKTK